MSTLCQLKIILEYYCIYSCNQVTVMWRASPVTQLFVPEDALLMCFRQERRIPTADCPRVSSNRCLTQMDQGREEHMSYYVDLGDIWSLPRKLVIREYCFYQHRWLGPGAERSALGEKVKKHRSSDRDIVIHCVCNPCKASVE